MANLSSFYLTEALPSFQKVSKMEIQIAPDTQAALKADATIRFFYKLKFKLDSRHSKPVLAWAESRANAASCAIFKAIGREEEAANVKIQMVMVHLLGIPHYALLCFDLLLSQDCCYDNTPLAQIQRRPIHEISERGKAYIVWRSKRLDAKVAKQLAFWQSVDKGPLPYFVDRLNPPFYDEGVRVEGPVDADDSEEENKSVEENGSKTMGTPKQVEEMTNEQMKGKLEIDKQKAG